MGSPQTHAELQSSSPIMVDPCHRLLCLVRTTNLSLTSKTSRSSLKTRARVLLKLAAPHHRKSLEGVPKSRSWLIRSLVSSSVKTLHDGGKMEAKFVSSTRSKRSCLQELATRSTSWTRRRSGSCCSLPTKLGPSLPLHRSSKATFCTT